MSHDEIRIIGLDFSTFIGVPDEERSTPQTLQADVVLRLPVRCEDLADEFTGTIDYEAVTRRLRQLALARPRKLIETLATEFAECALREFSATKVRVEIRKRILPGVKHVAAVLEREP